MEYTFTLKYRLSAEDRDQVQLVERLGEAGCDDALIGTGQPGRIAMEFTRQADSALAAILSALAAVKRSTPSATLDEVAPDFVGLTDVAEMVKVTRQNMRKLIPNHSASFPAPVHEGSSAIWHLTDVFAWCRTRGLYAVDQAAADVALIAKQIDIMREAAQLDPDIQRQAHALVLCR